MKIQKAIFSVSEPALYSSYWNMQSKLYKVGLGIDPICLLFGKKANTDMTEEYGKIIEMETWPDLFWVPQMTWSKFDYCRSEPDTTWIIGDMDLLPLSKSYFTEQLNDIPDDAYAHLNAAGIANPRCGRVDAFLRFGSERHGKDGGFVGCDLPAHYHVAKGSTFEKIYGKGMTFKQTVEHIINSDRYGMGVMANYTEEQKRTQTYWYYWLAEENYSSELLWNAIQAGQVSYRPYTYNNEKERVYHWDKERNDYIYEHHCENRYIDIHCCMVRPYAPQAEALERLVNLAGMFK